MRTLAERLRPGRPATRSRTEHGATLVEYAFLVAVVSLVCVGPLRALSQQTDAEFDAAASQLDSPPGAGAPDDGGPGGGDPGGGDPGGGGPGGDTTSWTGSGTSQDRNRWTAEASVTVHGADGRPLAGVNAGVNVRVVQVYRTWDGKVGERSWNDVGNLSGGVATFTLKNLATGANGGEAVIAMRYEVTGMNYYWPHDPDVRWDEVAAIITVDAP